MYVVLEKETNKIIYINPAPIEQNLSDKEIYNLFDSNKMYIAKCIGDLPENFVVENGYIREMTYIEKIQRGIIELDKNYKIVGNEIVEKTADEKYETGVITLEEYRELKYSALRRRRNYLLSETDWILIYIKEEDELILKGVKQNRRYTDLQVYMFLSWRQMLRDLPQTIDIDFYTYKDIDDYNNYAIYGKSPIEK